MKRLNGDAITIVQEIKKWRSSLANEKGVPEKLVTEIIQAVKRDGDVALRAFTKRFDQVDSPSFRVSEKEMEQALNRIDEKLLIALQKAKENIWCYHERQKRQSYIDAEQPGVIRGQLIRPLEVVGVYVPGGTASYPSSVLMNVIPAKIAGVKRIILVTPPHKEGVNPAVLAAATIAGVDEVYCVGGAQAIAALAYGTASIPKVDKIVGPGNEYVALAKRAVYGIVDIDMHAGPSEIIVVADETANPAFIAADLLSQAEHDTKSMAVCVTTSRDIANELEEQLISQIEHLPRKEIAKQALEQYGAIIVVPTVQAAIDVANELSPEHLELHVQDPIQYLHAVKHAGSIFLGPYTPEALGDYMAGPNHVLPTSGTARFSSPLSVDDFIKKSSFLSYSKDALQEVNEAICLIAETEGLHAHAQAITIRFQEEEEKEDGKALQTYPYYK
ncbi:histidinol dehydrogenase [Priestia taiwanensis]|uniref:Histidinol dehydrogenase n=1 Tax=Priestia taiwanensis TaxID=1347902 RepID=A0A917AIQ7_9BACI|nr:histidinol dehydrogenase [Priestia taiwanensis]MBM7361699.1 histidinol dehydrogenase [Priestia taiwanensis]GGE56312.1 histidinol dehydrogenase [Priestia taiwanensis]